MAPQSNVAAATSAPNTVREAPAPDPLVSYPDDPAHQALLDEPVLDTDDIQGNILAGFNKDHQCFLFLEIKDPADFQLWLATQIPFVATSSDVLAFNRLFKAIRSRRSSEAGIVKSTWMNIAFTYSAFQEMHKVVADLLVSDFTDEAFRQGLAERSLDLGDSRGATNNWLVGGNENCPLVIVQVASDEPSDLAREVARIEDSIYICTIQADGTQRTSGAEIVFKQNGENLPAPLAGHEHFGFLDGVSQPGIRGLLSPPITGPNGIRNDVLTLRQNPLKRDQPSTQGPNGTQPGTPAQGKPGQDLLWPGEFVFGYPTQNPNPDPSWDGPNPNPGPASEAGPAWANNGSFLVFRRLRQHVGLFHQFLKDTSSQHGTTPESIGSRLVGRWPSGAPVSRTAAVDNAALGQDDCANNNFEFQDTTPVIPPRAVGDPFACEDGTFPQAPSDPSGNVCPIGAHIRKAYPRDDVPGATGSGATPSPYGGPASQSTGKPATPTPPIPGCPAFESLNESDTQTHRLLRRGIPYGPVSSSTPASPVTDNVDRGLLFFCYQTSITRQFEFVTKCWINNPNFRDSGTGVDPLLGQVNDPVAGRARTVGTTIVDANGNTSTATLTLNQDFVEATGGGYFFAPSLSALCLIAGVANS